MDVTQAIRTRRSISKLGGDPGDAIVEELVELATWAPNHHLTEPWRFTVLRGAARERLGAVWGERAAASSGLAGEALAELGRRHADKLLRAPVLIVVSTRTDGDPVVAEEDFAATAAAVQNLLLAAEGLGLGAMWRTGALAHDPAVKAFLGLDPSDRIVAVVYLGSAPGVTPPPRQRSVAGVLRWMRA
jgi:nitroreductase